MHGVGLQVLQVHYRHILGSGCCSSDFFFFFRNLNLNQNILLGRYFKYVHMEQWVLLKSGVRFSMMVGQMNEQKKRGEMSAGRCVLCLCTLGHTAAGTYRTLRFFILVKQAG